MQNDFEKNIAQRMQDFSIAPQPAIWQQVEAALPPEKKRRRIALWWWLVPIASLLLLGFWLREKTHQQLVIKTEKKSSVNDSGAYLPTTKNQKEAEPQKRLDTQGDTTLQQSFTYQKNSQHEVILVAPQPVRTDTISTTNVLAVTAQKHSPKTVVWNKKSIVLNSRKAKKQTDSTIIWPGTGRKSSAGTVVNKINAGKLVNQPVPIPAMPAGSAFSVGVDSLNGLVKTDTVASVALAKLATANPSDTTKPLTDTATKNGARDARKIIAGKKKTAIWMAEVGVGLSGLYQPANSNKNYAVASYTSAGPVTGGSAANTAFIAPKTSFSFSLGINRKQTITPHWNWQLGFRYQLLSAVQSHGSQLPADSFINSSLSFDRSSTTLYSYGSALNYHNYVHQLQIIPRIEYWLNPTARLPVYFNAGFSIGYAVLSNQLLYNYSNRNYIRSAKYTTRLLYAAELGAGIFIRKKIYAGLTYQHGLSNVAKPALQSDFRWRVWQVRAGFPLFNHSSQ